MSIISMVIFFLTVLLVYGGANLYVGHRLYRGLKLWLPSLKPWGFVVIYGAAALSFVVSSAPLPAPAGKFFTWLGAYWLGIFVYLFLCFAAADVVLWIGKLTGLVPKPAPSPVRLGAWVIAVACAIALSGYGFRNATQIKEVQYRIDLEDGKLDAPMKIVMVSDLHLGAVGSESRIGELVRRINAMEPDLIAMPGDIFNDDFGRIQNPERIRELFRQLKATHGVYASLGNHDGGPTFEQMVAFLRDSNITLLMDEVTVADGRLAVAGRLDPSPIRGFGGLKRQDISHLLAAVDPNLPLIVLDHTPTKLWQYGPGVDLILSGHTHRGQIFPGSLITNLIYEVDYGHYQRTPGSPHVIVTSGAGTWGPPMRVGTYNEIVEIILE